MGKVTIITTTYNHGRFISETIESVLSQSYTDWEMLIGDDNSQDNTFEAVQKFIVDPRIKVWKHSKNLGLIGNINFLISQISGDTEYVAFLEGDDLYCEENLEKKLLVFSENPDVGLVYSDGLFIDGKSKALRKVYRDNLPYPNNTRILDFFNKDNVFECGIFSYSNFMIRKDILSEIGLIESLTKNFSVSDFDLCYRISKNYNLFGIDEILFRYRLHDNNMTGTGKIAEDMEILINRYLEIGFIAQEKYNLLMSDVSISKAYYSKIRSDNIEMMKSLFSSMRFDLRRQYIKKIALFIFIFIPDTIFQYLHKKGKL